MSGTDLVISTVCMSCGCVVADAPLHSKWHSDIHNAWFEKEWSSSD